jgi:hypothetical protein
MTGQFVRALGTVYHLNFFRFQDCRKVVASKFFAVNTGSPNGKGQHPLCETDYFRRLGLTCAKSCGALRGSHITAVVKQAKFISHLPTKKKGSEQDEWKFCLNVTKIDKFGAQHRYDVSC